METQILARQTLAHISQLDPEMQCSFGGTVLRELRDRVSYNDQDLIDRALGVMAKFPNFARPRAAVLIKALQSLAKPGVAEPASAGVIYPS